MKLPSLIPEWRKAWRFHSIRAAAALAALALVQSDVLPSVQPLVPPKVWPWVVAGFALTIGILRIVQQQKLHEGEESKQ